jgi:NAD(P)-dependent dehydrogenase (short-subunit alcohol dehydrogenase family)
MKTVSFGLEFTSVQRQLFNTMLLDISKRRILGRFKPEPLPPAGSFNGQKVLITGGTTGLGLAAAIHFATLGADVIITCRAEGKGEAARKQIEKHAQIQGKNKVRILSLDMSTYASCMAFMEQLKNHLISSGQLDVAVLNAGIINSDFEKSPEGW